MTVRAPVVDPVRLTVNVPGFPPPSAALASVATTVTVGRPGAVPRSRAPRSGAVPEYGGARTWCPLNEIEAAPALMQGLELARS